MKLEKNMYVRTKKGIAKIKTLCDLDNVAWTDNKNIFFGINRPTGKLYFELYDDGTVLKASHNIIDLIEVGDYVNGYQVTSKDQFLGIGNHDWYIADYEIKSIVTSQQFESMSYKIGD